MRARTTLTVSLTLLGVLLAVATGCSSGGAKPTTAVITSEPTGSSPATTAVASEPVTTPATGSGATQKPPRPTVKIPAPTLASFEAYTLKSVKSFAGSTYTGTFSIKARIAKDSAGVWWGNAIAEPSDSDELESIGIWGEYSGGKWTGEVADFSTEGADAGFFPEDVLADLAL